MDITSLQNPRVKHIVRLRDEKRQRKADGLMLVEGWDEIQLALSAGHQPRTILSAPELVSRCRVAAETDLGPKGVEYCPDYMEASRCLDPP